MADSADNKPTVDISLTIGGDAGQGVESSGSGFSLAFKRGGYQVFGMADYRSRIRGGHNFYQIRISDAPLYSHSDPPHLLLALTKDSIDVHIDHLADGGAIIYDDGFKVEPKDIESRGVKAFPVPLIKIAENHGSRVMMNTAALGAAAGILEFDLSKMEDVIREKFGSKGEKVVQGNIDVAKEAYDFAHKNFSKAFPWKLPHRSDEHTYMLINGNETFSLGAAAGGCQFISAYPMTPATTILEWMTHRAEELGIVTKHAEDELAAVCMALGASLAGARAMTSTSGGGFDLMVETLGLAGMTEVPLVVAEVQRGGPSTGLPTRTEQSDLLYVIHASHGEYPRVVLTPGTIEEYFECGWRAFNLADKYQTPVIVIADEFLGGSVRTVDIDAFDLNDVAIDRGKTLYYSDLEQLSNGHTSGSFSSNGDGNGKLHQEGRYLRFKFTDDGISPRAIPGHPDAVYAPSSDEHDEEGHISEDQDNRNRMQEKRMRKLEIARNEMQGPKLYGPETADMTLICWGSTYGATRETVDRLNGQGKSVNMLHFVDVWPMPVEKVNTALSRCKHSVCIEQNYTGQFAQLLQMTVGYEVDAQILKYDGRPFSPDEIVASLTKEVGVHA